MAEIMRHKVTWDNWTIILECDSRHIVDSASKTNVTKPDRYFHNYILIPTPRPLEITLGMPGQKRLRDAEKTLIKR